jgi:hypothetical protein
MLVAAVIAAGALLPSPATAAASGRAVAQLLPDLRPQKPRDLVIEMQGTHRILRLTTESVNRGTGPLELFPKADDCNGNGDFDNDRTAYQRVYGDTNGDGFFTRFVDQLLFERIAGCFRLHPEHNHWHFQNYAGYMLENLSDGTPVSVAEKVSFCVVDCDHARPGLPGSPPGAYFTVCDQNSTEGMSVGWGDIYDWRLPGQMLRLDGVPDGDYCVAFVADPLNRMVELDDTNNTAGHPVHIQGMSLTDLHSTCP